MVYALSTDEGRLTVVVGRMPARSIQPSAVDVFAAGGRTFRFQRGADGSVAGFILDAGRVRNLRFEKR